jgi:hypothetical protein
MNGSVSSEGVNRRWIQTTARMMGSLLLGGIAVMGSMLAFRRGLLPLIDGAFQLGPDWLVALRRAGILLTALAGYWAFVHWHEERDATELRIRPSPFLIAGAGGAGMLAVPVALLFAIGTYEVVTFRGASRGVLGVAAVIGIAATIEELVYRCLLLQQLEKAWGTRVALVVQAAVFALQHLENVAHGGIVDAVVMLVSTTLMGLVWGALFLLVRNLWVVAAHHAAWNFIIFLSGLPLSGIEEWRAVAPLESRYSGPDLLTGGMFGPESSLVVIVPVALAVVFLLRAAGSRGAFRGPVV